jgi:hypothetical protein
LEIYWGDYCEKGWKLTHTWVYRARDHLAGDVPNEFFPQLSKAQLRYRVPLGPASILNLVVARYSDPYVRYVNVYVDSLSNPRIPVNYYTVPGSYEFNIGSYAEGSMHELIVEIYWGGLSETGWRIDALWVHYESIYVEVDYMGAGEGCSGHRPTDTCLRHMQDYYKVHGYERVVFVIDQSLTHDNDIADDTEFQTLYYSPHFNHIGQQHWRYMLFAHYGPFPYLGWASLVPHRDACVIFDTSVLEFTLVFLRPHEWGRRLVVMHEVGHTLNILNSTDGAEVYCKNSYCCMAYPWPVPYSLVEYPWYCGFHWSLRSQPLWTYATW